MRPVYFCRLEFDGGSRFGKMEPILDQLSSWLKERYQAQYQIDITLPNELPSQPHQLNPVAGHEIVIHGFTNDTHRALEFTWLHPDGRDPSLVWRSSCTVAEDSSGAEISLLIQLASSEFIIRPARYKLGSPRFIRRLVASGEAYVGALLARNSASAFGADEIGILTSLLTLEDRTLPIVLFSPDPVSSLPIWDANFLAEKIAGIAIVLVAKDVWTTHAITEEFGKHFSCFNGAVRIYWPGFRRSHSPFLHPLLLGERVGAFANQNEFSEFMSKQIGAVAGSRASESRRFTQIKKGAIARDNEAALAKAKAEAATGTGGISFDEYEKLYSLWEEQNAQNEDLRRENENLKDNIKAFGTLGADDDDGSKTTITNAESDLQSNDPSTVREAVEVAQAECSHIIFLDSAFESADESPFKSPDRVLTLLRAIEAVGEETAEARAGKRKGISWRESFRQKGYDYKDDVSMTSKGKWKQEYEYIFKNRKRMFESHITIGAKTPDTCLSAHFIFDDDDKKFVVAHVGRHKTNTKS